MFSQALPTFDTFIFTTSFSYKYVNFAHYTWENRIFCLSEVFCDPNISQKCVSGWGYASDPPGELTMHPGPRPGIVGWGGDTPPQTQPHSAPSASRFSRFRRSLLVAEAHRSSCPGPSLVPLRCFRAGYSPRMGIGDHENPAETRGEGS